jgi:hypothetical protein
MMLNNNGELFSVAAHLGRGGEEVDMDMSQGDGGKVVAPFIGSGQQEVGRR